MVSQAEKNPEQPNLELQTYNYLQEKSSGKTAKETHNIIWNNENKTLKDPKNISSKSNVLI
jgi:hypothetical protein